MAFNKTFAIFALAAACVVSAMSFASAEEETFMQFAYIMDATVGPSSVYEIIDSPDCSEMSAKEAMFDDKCHAEAKRICSMMDDCGGFVIEPADVSNPSESGFSIVVFTEGAPIYAMEGATVFEFRGMVDAKLENDAVDKFISENIDHEHMQKEIEEALSTNSQVTTIELAIKAFLEAIDISPEEEEAIKAKMDQLTDIKQKEIQRVADRTMEKALRPIINLPSSRGLPILRPRVTCTRGRIIEPHEIAPPIYRPKRDTVFELGTCTEASVDGEFSCTCTEESFTPKSCTPAVFTPGTVGEITTFPAFEPLTYNPGSCSVQLVNVQKGIFG